MPKKHEIEYRALISMQLFRTLLEDAQKRNMLRGPLVIEDAYLCQKDVKNFSDIEMDEVGSYSLRIRRESDGGKESTTINMKIIQFEGDHNAWLEHEIETSSYEETKKIFQALGYKCYFELKKTRYTFAVDGMHICLEDIDNFQPAIEIEIIADESKTDSAKQKILQYLRDHQVSDSQILQKSITNLLMKERAAF